MPINRIFLIGAGGHGKVVFDALISGDIAEECICVRDDDIALKGENFLGRLIETPAAIPEISGSPFHLAIGNAYAREKLFNSLTGLQGIPLSILHPSASISRFSDIAVGTFIAAQAIIGPKTILGGCVIVNHGAVLDHDCIVGAFSHLAPNATLGGGVHVGSHVLIGAGATILPGITIGHGAVIGAGAVVNANVAAGATVAGVPARIIKGNYCG